MTITDIRPDPVPVTDLTRPHAGSEPVRLIAVNPWRPWAARTGGATLGTCLAAMITVVLQPHLVGWATATTLAVALLHAWVIGGYELREKHPVRFERVP